MTRSWLLLGLWSVSLLAQAGQFRLSPSSVGVARGQQSAEILVSYQPSAWIGDADVYLRLNLDQLGWLQAQPVESTTPDYVTACAVHNGHLSALVITRVAGPLPTQAPIPLCRLRVRAHAQAVQGIHTITATPQAHTPYLHPAPASANNVHVVVR